MWLCDCVAAAFPACDVTAVSTLSQARRALRSARVFAGAHQRAGVDVALIDIGLPDGSGIDLIGEIVDAGSDCVPIVTTIYDDPDQIFAAISAGAEGYLLKYHESDQLVRLLQRILDDEPPLSPAVARQVMEALRGRSPRHSEETALTAREAEVLSLLGRGFQLSVVAKTLAISHNTASTHVKSIYRKLNIRSRAEAALAARDRGLLSPGN